MAALWRQLPTDGADDDSANVERSESVGGRAERSILAVLYLVDHWWYVRVRNSSIVRQVLVL